MKTVSTTRATRFCALALLTCLLLALSLKPSQGVAQTARREGGRSALLVFTVSTENWPEANADPLVMVKGGKFEYPFDDSKEEEQKRFASNFLDEGRKYHLTFGGAEVGTLTIKGNGVGCMSLHAAGTLDADAESSKRIRAQGSALATNSDAFAHRSIARRSLTTQERASMLKLAKNTFRQHGAVAGLLSKMKVNNLTAIEVDNGGKTTLIGSFTIPEVRQLFLIVESAGKGYRIALANYEVSKEDPVYQIGKENLVDHLDLDGDGVSEIITTIAGFDAYGYQIYKRQRGRWHRIYSSGGDAC
ncbi:MAG: hypothetical protein WBP93_05410 [Pyrinomonadaceae bacterium]